MKIVIVACFLVATAFAEKPQRLRTRRAEEEHVWKKAMEALLDRGEKVEPIVWDALFLAQELEDASMSLPPTDAPSAAPTVTKDIATEQPSASPTGAPLEPPTAPPVEPPTAPPVVSPTDAPVIPPTAAPVTPPTSPPTDAPVPQPAPTDAPVGTTPAPSAAPSLCTEPPSVAPVPTQVNVDLSAWSTLDGNGNWVLDATNTTVTQTTNGRPTFFCSDFAALDNELLGGIRITTVSDNDFVGFALGYTPGDDMNEDADYVLIDWKQGTQTFNFQCQSSTALEGLAVSRVTGMPTRDELWSHQDLQCDASEGGVTELARGISLGEDGWSSSVDYEFRFVYEQDRLQVFVDGVLQADLSGDFPEGRFCFYNFSQSSVQYSGFTRISTTEPPTRAPLCS